MEFPEPTIDAVAALHELLRGLPPEEPIDRELTIAEAAAGLHGIGELAWSEMRLARLKALLAQAWEEGRWSPPGACLNPYGAPVAPLAVNGAEGFVGLRLLHLRQAAQAALSWIENMAPTVRRTALAEQLRSALGGK